MANYNLTSQNIKDTYQQLVQVSGSALVDGTGSLVTDFDYVSTSTFNAFSASISSSVDSKVSTTTFLAYTSSNSSSIANLQTQIDALEAGSGSATWDLITGKPDGLVSSSAQIASDISGAFTSTSASLAADIATNKSDIATKLATSTFTSYSSSVSTRLTTDEGNISTNASDIASLTAETSSYAVKTSNNVFSGTQTFESIAVNGTASIAYLQAVTGSAKIVGDAFIILNADTPSQRYAGLKVYDSGSSPISTGSFIWDSVNNDWFYEYEKDATDYAVALFGPEFATKGTPSYPTSNVIQKGTGGHHLADSNITDDGTSVSISTPLTATEITASTGFKGDLSGTATNATSASYALTASYALNAAGGGGGLVAGDSGIDSMKSSGTLTTTAASANGPQSIAIGNAAKVSGTASLHISLDDSNTFVAGDQTINIGKDINNTGGYSTAIGHNITNTGTGGNVLIGRSIVSANDYSIGIGEGVNVAQGGVAIGQSANNQYNGVAVGNNARTADSYAAAFGLNTNAGANAAIVVGADASSTSVQAIVIGVDTSIDGSSRRAVALGQDADIATSEGGITLGGQARVTGATGGIAIGWGSSTTGAYGIAIGSGSKVTAATEINIGGIFKYDGSSDVTFGTATTVEFGNNITSVTSGSSTGSLIDNLHPTIASGSPQIEHIVAISQSAYTALSASGNVYDNTLYIISDNNSNVYPGNLEVSGQIYTPTFAGSIASSTSSIDFDSGNFATLNCASSTFLANPSNLKSGTTYTIIVTNGANISGYGTVWKFAGGTEPTLSANTDVLTCVSDGTSLYATGLADFS